MIWGSGGSKSRLAKAAEPAGQIRDEKLHSVVARSTFASQNAQNTWCSEHSWKLRCRKNARRCGAKHISKSKCTKHTRCGSLLAVEMSKKCTPLWREAHFEVKMYKTPQRRTTFGSWDVEKVHAVVARSTFPSQNVQNTPCTDHFWRFRCRFAWQAQGIVDLVKSDQNMRVLFSKNDGRHGTFEEDLQRCIFVAGAVQKTCSWEMLGGQGADFLRGVAFWSIRCAGLLRWFCVTGAALRMTWHQFFVAGAVR